MTTHKYELLNNSGKALELYPTPSSAGKPFTGKLSVNTTAYGSEMQGVWLKTFVKNNTGWIDTRQGDLTINDDAPDVPPVIEGFPKWAIINLDYDEVWDDGFKFAHHVSRPKRNNPAINVEKGLPQVARFTLDTRIRFTEDLQYWIHGLCSERIPSKSEAFIKAAHASLWREAAFMTNEKGMAGRRDYINRTNLGGEYVTLQPMACGGTLLKIVGETVDDWIFEAINPLGDYRQYDPSNPQHRHLFFEPTNSRRQKIKNMLGVTTGWDESISIPFAQYDNKSVVPIFGDGNTSRNRIQKWRTRILHNGEPVPSPYQNSGGYVYPNPYQGMTG